MCHDIFLSGNPQMVQAIKSPTFFLSRQCGVVYFGVAVFFPERTISTIRDFWNRCTFINPLRFKRSIMLTTLPVLLNPRASQKYALLGHGKP
jgi:hypothetical protein